MPTDRSADAPGFPQGGAPWAAAQDDLPPDANALRAQPEPPHWVDQDFEELVFE